MLEHCLDYPCFCTCWLTHEIALEPKSKSDRSVITIAPASAREPSQIRLEQLCTISHEAIDAVVEICKSVATEFPHSSLGRACGDAERDEWLAWIGFGRSLAKAESSQLEVWWKALEKTLEREKRVYLVRSGFSVADIVIGAIVYNNRHLIRFEEYPNLAGWYLRISARPAFCACEAASDLHSSMRESLNSIAS